VCRQTTFSYIVMYLYINQAGDNFERLDVRDRGGIGNLDSASVEIGVRPCSLSFTALSNILTLRKTRLSRLRGPIGRGAVDTDCERSRRSTTGLRGTAIELDLLNGIGVECSSTGRRRVLPCRTGSEIRDATGAVRWMALSACVGASKAASGRITPEGGLGEDGSDILAIEPERSRTGFG